MLEDPKTFLESLHNAGNKYARVDMETLKAFGKLNETVLNSGVLDRKTKSLMCVAIGIANRCEYCIAARIAQAVEAGATREELIETASVGLLMGGSLAMGPLVTLFVDTINLLVPEAGK